jgi:hypothetical protein
MASISSPIAPRAIARRIVSATRRTVIDATVSVIRSLSVVTVRRNRATMQNHDAQGVI